MFYNAGMQETKYDTMVAPRLEEIGEMARKGMSLHAIAKSLGIGKTSLDRYRHEHKDLANILGSLHKNKGHTNNPNGRPKTPEDVKEAFRSYTKEALEILVRIMQDENQKASDRLRAADSILDRGWGKPYQQIQLDEQREKTINVKLTDDMKEWLC
jgi:hypothetical protein